MKFKSLLFSCLLGTAGVLSTQAIAGGSIGGDCCADLEERVAELEATTARKGNRKVSLTISGTVHKALMWSDADNKLVYLGGGNFGTADRSDLAIVETAQMATKFRLIGKARISSDMYAGYRLEFGVGSQYESSSPAITLRHNDLFIGSKTFGKVSIGHGSTATDYTAEQDLSGTNYWSGGNLTEYNIYANLDGFSRTERIRYDTPSIAGFTASVSWQEDEDFDAALAYAGSLGDFLVAAKVGYYEEGTPGGGDGVTGSISALHKPTGLSLTFAAAEADTAVAGIADTLSGNGDGDFSYWYVKAGLQRKIFAAGKTAFAVDYHEFDDGFADKIGAQIVQDIDAAAMKIHLSVWSADSDNDLQDETAGLLGVAINF